MGSASLRVKLGVAKPMTAKGILKKVENGLSVFNRFCGSPESAGRIDKRARIVFRA